DGIRDATVTGVQTCALPISFGQRAALEPLDELKDDLAAVQNRNRQQVQKAERQRDEHQETHERGDPGLGGVSREFGDGERTAQRSEERRVGKEWKCGWCAYQ